MKKTTIVLCSLASIACAAQSVTSAYVAVLPPGNVFAPIPEATGGNDTARLVDTTNVFTAAYVQDFEVDGDMSKDVWRKVQPVAPFLPIGTRTFSEKTDLRLLYSATSLYVGFTFWQRTDKMRAQYDQDDQSLFGDDNIEAFFLVPNKRGEDMLHLAINALGSCYDAKNGRMSWNAKGRKIKVKKFADRWTAEIRVPFSSLGIDRPVPGDFIGARFCRHMTEPRQNTSAPRLPRPGNNARRTFAKLLFGAPDAKSAAEACAWRENVTKARTAKRLADAKRKMVSLEAAAVQFPDQTHPVYSTAVQAICQMKAGLEKFEKGKLSTADFIALDAGFRKYASEHAYAAWTASPWERGSPDKMPPESVVGLPRLSFEQAGNEREQVCLEFTGLLCGPRLDLRIVPLTVDETKKKRFVSCDAFEIYEEPFVNYEKELITAPLVQKPGNMVTLTPGRTVRVWVVFNSRGVEPGEYKTKILLKPAYDTEIAERSIDVDMKVWNFALPETREWPFQTFFWGPNYYDNDETQVLRLMHGHHVTHGWTKSQLYRFGILRDCKMARPAVPKEDPVYFDRHLAETANEEFFRTAKDLGMRFVFGWGFPDRTPEWLRLMDQRLRGMGFGPGDYVFKGLLKDEFVKHHIPLNADRRAAVTKELGTNLWFQCVYLSTPPPTGATMEDIEEAKLPEFYKMFTVIDGVFRDPKRGPDVTRRLRAKGCQVWTYMCSRYMQTQDVLNYYRFYLWRAYMRGLDGAAMWTSGGRYGDDGWDSRDAYDDGILWAGNGKEMIPTKRFESFREGLEDIAYMSMLEKAGTDEAKALLNAREDVIKAHDHKVLDAWRLSAGRAISKMKSAK